MIPRLLPLAALAVMAACSAQPASVAIDPAGPAIDLTCYRETGASMLAAHRGGPAAGYPENALSSLQRLADMGVLYAEIDVRRSADGTLFLLHDDTLDRTTTGTGPLDGRAWSELSALRLRDPAGEITDDTIPTLADAMALAQEAGLVLNLDLKSVSPAEIVAFVHTHEARDDIALIAYSVDQAAAIHALDPGLLLSAPDQPDALAAAGVNLESTYIWLGVGAADAGRDAALADEGLETSAGLFPLEAGTPDPYRAAAEAGVELLSIDDVDTAVAALGGPGALQARIDACAAN